MQNERSHSSLEFNSVMAYCLLLTEEKAYGCFDYSHTSFVMQEFDESNRRLKVPTVHATGQKSRFLPLFSGTLINGGSNYNLCHTYDVNQGRCLNFKVRVLATHCALTHPHAASLTVPCHRTWTSRSLWLDLTVATSKSIYRTHIHACYMYHSWKMGFCKFSTWSLMPRSQANKHSQRRNLESFWHQWYWLTAKAKRRRDLPDSHTPIVDFSSLKRLHLTIRRHWATNFWILKHWYVTLQWGCQPCPN